MSTVCPAIHPDTYAERQMQLRDARYHLMDCGYRLRLAVMELTAALDRCYGEAQTPIDQRCMVDQRQRAAMVLAQMQDLESYMEKEEAWSW